MNEQQPQHNSGHEQPGNEANPEREVHRETEPTPTPRIYVACLSAYNNGYLHGVWLDAARDADDIHTDIQAMLATSPMHRPDQGEIAEEFAIHDYDEFGPVQIHEYDSISLVARIARGVAEHGYAFAAWADVHESDPELFDHFETAFLGRYDSLQDYADQLIDDLGYQSELDKHVPANLRPYVRIDTEALARDLYLEGDINAYETGDGGVWLFDERA
ncbi:antirestriction protein ArdA [Antrihabitans spumae]|uniref:Antirestriction protein ArdA n=1 Tax=Antrihabitans spumae TaxID=3373370 RepID=A0ABW7KGU6_9NOCA